VVKRLGPALLDAELPLLQLCSHDSYRKTCNKTLSSTPPQDYRPGLTRADVEAQQRAQRRAEGRPDDAAPERSHAQHAKTFDGPPPRGSGGFQFWALGPLLLEGCWHGLSCVIGRRRSLAPPSLPRPAGDLATQGAVQKWCSFFGHPTSRVQQ
jgi:hypothetical protein